MNSNNISISNIGVALIDIAKDGYSFVRDASYISGHEISVKEFCNIKYIVIAIYCINN